MRKISRIMVLNDNNLASLGLSDVDLKSIFKDTQMVSNHSDSAVQYLVVRDVKTVDDEIHFIVNTREHSEQVFSLDVLHDLGYKFVLLSIYNIEDRLQNLFEKINRFKTNEYSLEIRYFEDALVMMIYEKTEQDKINDLKMANTLIAKIETDLNNLKKLLRTE